MLDTLDAAEESGDVGLVNEIEAHLWLDGPQSTRGRVSGAVRDLFLDMNGIALGHDPLTREVGSANAWNRLPELAVPTLVLWGALDFPHIRARCEALLERIGGATGRALDGLAHLPSFEDPGRTNPMIGAFLERLSR